MPLPPPAMAEELPSKPEASGSPARHACAVGTFGGVATPMPPRAVLYVALQDLTLGSPAQVTSGDLR
jgi:hypothetical protein